MAERNELKTIIDEIVDEGVQVPGFLKNPEAKSEHLLPGLTREQQNALIRKVSRDIYKKSRRFSEKANGGSKISPRHELELLKKSDELATRLHRMPSRTQDSHLMSLVDGNGYPSMIVFKSPEEISRSAGRNAGAFYSPSTNDIILPEDADPEMIIHENTHRTGHLMNPENKRFQLADVSPFWAESVSSIPDYFAVKNIGKSIEKDIVEPVRNGMTDVNGFGGVYYEAKRSANENLNKHGYIDDSNIRNIADMVGMSPNTNYFFEKGYGHGTKYRNDWQEEGRKRIDHLLKHNYNKEVQSSIANYPLSMEGTAEYEELVSKNNGVAKMLSPTTYRRLEAMYGADWRKALLKKQVEDGYVPVFYKDIDVSGKPSEKFFETRGEVPYRYNVRVQRPYGGYHYGEYPNAKEMIDENFANGFEYRNLDDEWSKGTPQDVFARSYDPGKNNMVDVVKKYPEAFPPSVFLKRHYRVNDNFGNHYFLGTDKMNRYVGKRMVEKDILGRDAGIRTIEMHDGNGWKDAADSARVKGWRVP